MINSLRFRVLAWFLAFAFLVLATFIPSNLYYFNRKDEISEIISEINLIHRDLLKDLNNNEAFFQYEITNSDYFITGGKSSYLENHERLTTDIIEKLENLNRFDNFESFELNERIDDLKADIYKYNSIFRQIVKLIYDRGYKDYGTVGLMRDYIHRLEKTPGLDQTYVLSLRRHEKDYIIRNEQQYINKLNNLANRFKNRIEAKTSFSSLKKDEILDILDKYQNLFNRIVELDKQIGIKNNTGLKLQHDQQVFSIETEFLDLIDKAEKKKVEMFHKLEYYYAISSFFIIVIGILLSTLMIRKVTMPLRQLTEYITTLMKNDFKKQGKINMKRTDFEVRLIYNEFNNMVDRLHSREIQRDNALQAMRESEMKYRELADMLPQSIFETDDKGNYTYVNRAWINKLGYSQEDIDNGLNILQTLVSEDPNKNILDNRLENSEFIGIKKSGKEFPALLYSNKIQQDSKTSGTRGIIIDITERRKYIEALKREKTKAEKSDKLKSSFLANMSHEIRTPMNAIIGFSDLLASDELDHNDRKEYIRHIRNSGELLLNIINDIIDIAKIEAGEVKIIEQDCNIHDILNEAYVTHKDILTRTKKDRYIELKCEKGSENTFFIKSDPFRIKQVLSNLISNAVKFTDSGEVKFGYEFIDNSQLLFFVKDTGIGLPPDKADIIFERFRQVEESSDRNYGGTGLGLAITKNLVELLGGKIWLESEEKKGSVFYFTLPVNAIRFLKVQDSPVATIPENHQWAEKTFLIAEDDDSNFKVLNEYLHKTRVNLLRANDGLEAVEICMNNHQTVDLILMDIQMPRLNGYEATKAIKKEHPQIPVIAQTAYAMSGEKEKSYEAGCDDYISKPLDKKLLFSKISQLLCRDSIIPQGQKIASDHM
jgi:PAS domain S-box-containing protein